eukprot:c9720_g1_i1.p3 GENE.c9720_g1_i1~~c9720_g1_i1.p3  ORF type:complete len:131 (+),score=39.82 c9720_g1_i1:618-1010(+)
MIYSPAVPIFRRDDGTFLTVPHTAAFITAPCINRNVTNRNNTEYLPTLLERIRRILAISAQKNHNHVILGAYGCGVFKNDPEEVAQAFQEVLQRDFRGVFETVVFAIPITQSRNGTDKKHDIFRKVFLGE